MLLKIGVTIEYLKRTIRRKLPVIDSVFLKRTGREAVITETRHGAHSSGSLHYSDEAVDIRLPETDQEGVVSDLMAYLGSDFDVIAERDHIHVEYDPKP